MPVQPNSTTTLKSRYFGHPAGERITILEFKGGGLYRVQFTDGSTATIGRGKFN